MTEHRCGLAFCFFQKQRGGIPHFFRSTDLSIYQEIIMLEVTETALTNVKKYLSENNIESAVRITMMSGGCSGNSLALALDEAKENDLTSEQGGVNFLVEKGLAETCGTITVDFTEASGSGCGCSGGGFSIKSEKPLSGDEQSGCGCSCTSGSCG